MRRLLIAAFYVFLATPPACAQPLRFQLLAGAGMNGALSHGGTVNYKAIVLPCLSAGLRIPLTEAAALLTGADWMQKGFQSQQTSIDTAFRTRTAINGTVRYTQVNIPLQLAVRLLRVRQSALEFSGGMSYGFMIAARADWSYSTYYAGGKRDDYGGQSKPRIALLPRGNRLGTPNSNASLYLFNPAFAGALTLQARKHLLVQVYGAYNLYDAASESYVAPVNLYSLGVCAGYRF